jgi:hypothetical protein
MTEILELLRLADKSYNFLRGDNLVYFPDRNVLEGDLKDFPKFDVSGWLKGFTNTIYVISPKTGNSVAFRPVKQPTTTTPISDPTWAIYASKEILDGQTKKTVLCLRL